MFNKNKSFWAAFHNKQMENLDDALKDTNRTVQDMPGMVALEPPLVDVFKQSRIVCSHMSHMICAPGNLIATNERHKNWYRSCSSIFTIGINAKEITRLP